MSLANVKSEPVEDKTAGYTEHYHTNAAEQTELIHIKTEPEEESETKNTPVTSSQQDGLYRDDNVKPDLGIDDVKEEISVAEINKDSLLNFIKDEIKSESSDRITSFSVDESGAHINYQSIINKDNIEADAVPQLTHLNRDDEGVECSSSVSTEFNHQDVLSKPSVQKNNVCSICSKSFRIPSLLKKHMVTHSTERPYSCTVCKKTFPRMDTLTWHERMLHTDNHPVCKKTFSLKGTLKRHETMHNGNLPFVCSVCGKGFASKAHLIIHERSHNGQRPFICTVCGRAFMENNSLKTHVKLLHGGEKPFACSVCERSFIRKCDLNRHSITVYNS